MSQEVGEEEEEEEEEEEGLFKADAVNEEDPERDRATQEEEGLFKAEEEEEEEEEEESLFEGFGATAEPTLTCAAARQCAACPGPGCARASHHTLNSAGNHSENKGMTKSKIR